ncbi:hypothetical protein PV04_09403 [Phialophora macrospora]|uniref:Uncharacterized protein n=1 Tax=Phialophora macrospora TaxID=1851006 RepID=A0A0D2DQI6_9EURO|nr:hypothetical protein PV04_09403 [Phialophora macrospora]
MPLPRSAALRGSIRSFSLKRVGIQARTSLRGVGRRSYASEHGTQKSSDLPWLIGSIVVTVPAAGWLWQQGPTKSDHGHGHDAHAEKQHEDAPAEDSEEEEESPKEDSGKDEDDKQEEGKEEGKEESDDQGEGEDKEVTPKGTAVSDDKSSTSESKGAKDAQGDVSGSKNPFMDSSEEAHKPEGPAATAKIHGTVDKSTTPDETDEKK